MTSELIKSVVEILESAHHYRYELSEVSEGIKNLQDQINKSSDQAHKEVDSHFSHLKSAIVSVLDERVAHLKSDIEKIRSDALKPLDECKTLVDENMTTAAQVMDEGAAILSDNPEENSGIILKFKDNPKTKALSSVPAIPSPSEVACVNISLSQDLVKQLTTSISTEGHILCQAPVQISEVIEKPGGLLVSWAEVEDEGDLTPELFWLQYASGIHREIDPASTTVFHTAYQGPCSCSLIKQLKTRSPYTMRVCGRPEGDGPWSAWSIPRVATTTLEHYKWSPSPSAYCLSNEDKVATRAGHILSHILWSHEPSLRAGNTLTVKVLDDADKSPGDGFCICSNNTATDFFGQEDIVYVNMYGSVYVNGQEMKMKLAEIKKGSVVAFETEALPNGKVRVSVQHEDQALTFDWKLDAQPHSQMSMLSLAAMGAGEPGGHSTELYFGLKFSQEDWKVAVD